MTTFLSSGWENSGGSDVTDNAAWDYAINSGATLSISSSVKHSGNYAFEISGLGSQGNSCYLEKRATSTDFCVRAFMYLTTHLPLSGKLFYLMHFQGGTYDYSLQLERDGSGVYFLSVTAPDYGSWGATVTITPNTWFWVEVDIHEDPSNGSVTLYYNDENAVAEGTGLNLGSSAMWGVDVGATAQTAYSGNIFFDDVVISNTYIGPIAGTSSASKNLSSSFKVVGITNSKNHRFDPAYFDPAYFDTSAPNSLSSSFTVRRTSKNLSSSFTVRSSNILLNSGWELSGGSDVTDGGIWLSSSSLGATMLVSSSVKHSGNYALEITNMAANGSYGYVEIYPGKTTLCMRVYIYLTADLDLFSYLNYILYFSGGSYTYFVQLYRGGDGNYSLYVVVPGLGSVIGSPIPSFALNTWHWIEMDIHEDMVNGTVNLYYDSETPIASLAGLNLAGYPILSARVEAYAPAGYSGNIYFDDAVISLVHIGPKLVTYNNSKDLSCKFAIKKPSKDLSSSFTIRKKSSKNLSSSFTVVRSSSKNLSCQFIVPKQANRDLSSSFLIRNYRDLSSSFKVRNNPKFKDLSTSLTVRKKSSADLSASFIIRKSSYKDLSSSLSLRKVSIKDASASVTIRNKSYVNSGRNSITIVNRGSRDLSSSFGVRKDNLRSSFTIRKSLSKDLPSSIYINMAKNSKDASSSFTCRKTGAPKDLSCSITVHRMSVNSGRNSITIRNKGTKDLSSNFQVRKGNDLSSSFTIRKKTSRDLSSSLYVNKAKSKDFSSNFTIRKASSKDLSSSITVLRLSVNSGRNSITIRNKSAKDLHSSFSIGYHTISNLSSSFTIRKKSSVDLSSSFKAMHPASKNLSCSFTPRDLTSRNLPSSLTVRAAGNVNSGRNSFTLRLRGSKDFSSSFTIRKSSAVDLHCKFIVHRGSDLSSNFTIRQPSSANTSSSFTVGKEASKNLSCSFVVHRPYLDLSSSFAIRRSGYNRCHGSFTVHNQHAANLPSSFSIGNSRNLSSSFTIGPGKFGYTEVTDRSLVKVKFCVSTRGQVSTWTEANK